MKYISVEVELFKNKILIKTLKNRPLRISPNNLPSIVYKQRVYEIPNGHINLSGKTYRKNDCGGYYDKKDFLAQTDIQLLRSLSKVKSFDFIFGGVSSQKFEHRKYAYVTVPLYKGKKLIRKLDSRPIRKSPNGIPSIVYRKRVYEIANGYADLNQKTYALADCKDYYNPNVKNLNLSSVLVKVDECTIMSIKEYKKQASSQKKKHNNKNSDGRIKLSGQFN